jgi:endo-1,4-beta-xylanase
MPWIFSLFALGCTGTEEGSDSGVGGVMSAGGATTIGGASNGGSPSIVSGTLNPSGGKIGVSTAITGGTTTTVGSSLGTGGNTATTTGKSVTTGGTTSSTLTSKTTGGTTSINSTKTTGGASTVGGTKATGGTSATTSGTKATGGGTSTTTGGTTSSTIKKFVGNITTGNGSVDFNGMKYSKYWDQITPENAGKWGSVQGSVTSAFNWGTLDSVYKYAESNGILFKQHVFVWGAQQPSGTPTLAQVETWIKSFCQRFPNTKIIDVVNEPPPHTTPNYTSNLGAGEGGKWPWITKAFKLARQHCPNAILLLNDYNNLEYGDQEQHFIDIVKDIKANGAPIDAVGCQAHGLRGVSSATLKTNLNTMSTGTGLPIYITEYDIGEADDGAQLTNFKNHMTVFWESTNIKGITVWGWIDGKTWVKNTGLVKNTAPRSAMTWLMGYLNRPVPPN